MKGTKVKLIKRITWLAMLVPVFAMAAASSADGTSRSSVDGTSRSSVEGASRSSVDATSRCPNILLIISDDQGYGDFGFTGNKLADTPVLDRLSKEGAFYPNFMVAPACSPTRSALLTGRNHLDVGVWGVGPRGDERRDEVLMPSFFNPSGYNTWLFGKWDGAKMMELGPVDRGFDWFCGIGGGYLQKRPLLCTPEGGAWTEGWSAELITDAAIKKINESGDTPWLAHMAYIIPHLPWECPDSYADPYRKKGYSETFAQCYGSIKQMDDQIGRLLDAVHDAGQDENTIVLFMSDNGPTENRGAYVNDNFKHAQNSKDWKLRNACDLTGAKAEVWDAGIRSPLLVRWPGRIKPGIRKHVPMVEDLLPTVLDLAQISEAKQPKHLPFDGKSIRASLEDPRFTDERDIFRIALDGPGNPGDTTPSDIIEDARETDYSKLHTVLRRGIYKFHHLPSGEVRLYDMEKDPGEKNDLSKKMPERTEELAQRCRARWDDIASRNRTFPMRQLKIDNADRWSKSWTLRANQALHFEGKMQSVFYGGAKGFRSPGDRADYTVEVQKPLTVSFVAEGKGLDQCAPISLLVDGNPIEVKSRDAKKIVFGSASLPAGTIPVSLAVPADSQAGSADGEVIKVTLKLER
jgi:arylsulfatase A-like enzyme